MFNYIPGKHNKNSNQKEPAYSSTGNISIELYAKDNGEIKLGEIASDNISSKKAFDVKRFCYNIQTLTSKDITILADSIYKWII